VGHDLGPVTALAGPFFHMDAVVASTVSQCNLTPGSVRPGFFFERPAGAGSHQQADRGAGSENQARGRAFKPTLIEDNAKAHDEARPRENR
jgi:hypothetical protein